MVRSQIRVRGVTGDGREIHDVLIPVPLVTRTGTNGDMVNAHRRQQKMAIGDESPSSQEKYSSTVNPVESRRRLALARGTSLAKANVEACVLKEALHAMTDDHWWTYEFELIGGWMTFLDPFLDVVQGGRGGGGGSPERAHGV